MIDSERRVDHQPSLHVSIQAADGVRRNHAFRSAARSHDRVHSTRDHRSRVPSA